MVTNDEKLGKILVRSKYVTEQDVEEALEEQKKLKNKKPLGKVLLEQGRITENQLAEALAAQKGLPIVELEKYTINPHAAYLISEDFARNHKVFAFDLKDNELYLAMANPLNVQAIDDLRVITGMNVKPFVAVESEVERFINDFFKPEEDVYDVEEVVKEALEYAAPAVEEREEEEVDIAALREMVKEVPIVRLANRILTQAVEQRASDIHIEPYKDEFNIRFRVDGVLHNVMTLPKKIQPAFVSRLKIMGDLDIAERRIPQSGSCNLVVSGKYVDLRITTLPTNFGEGVIIRILDKSQALFKLEDLGFQPETLEKYRKCFKKAYGTILVTGPTGSGKSTTLYATLNELNTPDKKIITVEDPVEYNLPGLTQVQVRPKAGLTFASALRAIVRADPDIIMIGEIRDLETAQIAIRAALTGHLVLATLHTNDAPGAVTRLTDMGLEAFFLSSVICVVAQRLARKLCPHCKEEYEPDEEILKEYGFPFEPGERVKLYKAKGCEKCHNTGYHGRIGVYELMLVNDDIVKLAVEGRPTHEIKKLAIEQGMETLRDDGFKKVKAGITSLEEVMRVVV